MPLDIPRPDGLIIVRSLTELGVDDRPLRTMRERGEVDRLRRGAYVSRETTSAADRDARYDLRIRAALATRRSPVVLSHLSAARVRGLPVVNPWPRDVHITVAPESAKRTKNGVVVHRHSLRNDEVEEHGGMQVTGLIRTLIDVARSSPFRDAVAATDSALQRGLVTKDLLFGGLAEMQGVAGWRRAERVFEFASPLAKLPGESFSRVLMHELGFPPPILQYEFPVPLGRRRFADCWWPGLRLIGEFDGRDKYSNPAYANRATPEERVWAEKLRENELRDHGASIVRWVWADLVRVEPFIRRLEVAGLRRDCIQRLL